MENLAEGADGARERCLANSGLLSAGPSLNQGEDRVFQLHCEFECTPLYTKCLVLSSSVSEWRLCLALATPLRGPSAASRDGIVDSSSKPKAQHLNVSATQISEIWM